LFEKKGIAAGAFEYPSCKHVRHAADREILDWLDRYLGSVTPT